MTIESFLNTGRERYHGAGGMKSRARCRDADHTLSRADALNTMSPLNLERSRKVVTEGPQLHPAGAAETRQFYDQRGWARQGEKLVDTDLFGVKEDGPIRQAGHRVRTERIREEVRSSRGEGGARLLECGCGGNPATFLADLCAHFTAVDFSSRGLA